MFEKLNGKDRKNLELFAKFGFAMKLILEFPNILILYIS